MQGLCLSREGESEWELHLLHQRKLRPWPWKPRALHPWRLASFLPLLSSIPHIHPAPGSTNRALWWHIDACWNTWATTLLIVLGAHTGYQDVKRLYLREWGKRGIQAGCGRKTWKCKTLYCGLYIAFPLRHAVLCVMLNIGILNSLAIVKTDGFFYCTHEILLLPCTMA